MDQQICDGHSVLWNEWRQLESKCELAQPKICLWLVHLWRKCLSWRFISYCDIHLVDVEQSVKRGIQLPPHRACFVVQSDGSQFGKFYDWNLLLNSYPHTIDDDCRRKIDSLGAFRQSIVMVLSLWNDLTSRRIWFVGSYLHAYIVGRNYHGSIWNRTNWQDVSLLRFSLCRSWQDWILVC